MYYTYIRRHMLRSGTATCNEKTSRIRDTSSGENTPTSNTIPEEEVRPNALFLLGYFQLKGYCDPSCTPGLDTRLPPSEYNFLLGGWSNGFSFSLQKLTT